MTVSEPLAIEIVGALSGLVRTARSYAHVRHEQLGPTGIALAILTRLGQEPSRSGDIAGALGVSASAVSRAVTTLESLGHVRREPDPADARAHRLSLTPSGTQFLAEQHREHARRVAAVLEDWDDAKAQAVLEGLTELDAALGRTLTEMRAGGPAAAALGPLSRSLTTALAATAADEPATPSTPRPRTQDHHQNSEAYA